VRLLAQAIWRFCFGGASSKISIRLRGRRGPHWDSFAILAIGVLISHVGGGNWVIARTAVFCFYFVSGFLICRVLDTSYRSGIERVAAFYVNRALRLLPLYLLIVFATFAIFSIRGSASFVRLGDGETVSMLYLGNFSTLDGPPAASGLRSLATAAPAPVPSPAV
jgi:peptidoglycan/LPS O-acetylase OafA/YrhL